MNLKLGKLPPRHDLRTLRLERYLSPHLAKPPLVQDWSNWIASPWKMLANDRIGDCTIAAAGHLEMLWTSVAGQEFIPSDQEIISAYSAVSGYDPATGIGDVGAVELDVLNYWRKVGIAGRRIGAYAAVNPQNVDYIKWSILLFGGVYIGLALPLSAQLQQVWDVVSGPDAEPGSWGGHAVPVVAYDEQGPTCVTWGGLIKMTWEFWAKYCDEAYAIWSPDWINSDKSPAGVDLATLATDLRIVSQ